VLAVDARREYSHEVQDYMVQLYSREYSRYSVQSG